jgi:hypothetical protein
MKSVTFMERESSTTPSQTQLILDNAFTLFVCMIHYNFILLHLPSRFFH